jgi:hypothetical protein
MEDQSTRFVTGDIDVFPVEGTALMTAAQKLETAAPGTWYAPSRLPLGDSTGLAAFSCLVGVCESVYADVLYDRDQFSRCSCSALAGVCSYFPDSSLCAWIGTSTSKHVCDKDSRGRVDSEWQAAQSLAQDPSFSHPMSCFSAF